MVIKSTVDMSEESVQYFNPCDTFKLCASKGEFSVDADRANVNGTLGRMISAKSGYYDARQGRSQDGDGRGHGGLAHEAAQGQGEVPGGAGAARGTVSEASRE